MNWIYHCWLFTLIIIKTLQSDPLKNVNFILFYHLSPDIYMMFEKILQQDNKIPIQHLLWLASFARHILLYCCSCSDDIVFLLSSLSAVLSMAVHNFIALLLHLKTQQEFLTAQTQWIFVDRAKWKRIAVKKARALLSRPGWVSQTVYMRKKVVSPTRVTLPAEARQLASPSWLAFLSCLALPSCLTHFM